MTTAMKLRTTPRAEETRKRIYDAALELFRERGFEQTTMRDIAQKAGVALGGAYYYFASKEAIVLAFYQEVQHQSHEEILELLQQSKKLKDRIRCIVEKRLAACPQHAVHHSLCRARANPDVKARRGK